MRTIRSIAFLFVLLGCFTRASSFTHRELKASSNLESPIKSKEDTGHSKTEDDTVAENNSTVTSVETDDDYIMSTDDDDDLNTTSKHSKKPKKTNSTVSIPGQQETDYVNTSISQWDITNKSMISMNHTISNSTKLLPKERPQSTGWIQTCLGIFLGFSVILFGLTAHQKYRKRMHYEDAPEMQSLVV